MAMLGLVGGPLVAMSGLAVVMGIIGRGSAAQSKASRLSQSFSGSCCSAST